MFCQWKAYSALAAFLLAASPGWAMSVVPSPANNAASRFADPNAAPQRGFSGSVQTVIVGRGSGAFGYGGSAAVGTSPLGRVLRPDERSRSDLGPAFSNRGFPDSSLSGFGQTDSFFGPRDLYVPPLRGVGR